MRAVIDSGVLVDYLQGSPAAALEISRYEERCISLVSWMEVMAGLDEEMACRRFLGSFRLLPVTLAVAERAVRLRRRHRLKLPDAVIWASAQEAGGLLVTRNRKDFPARRSRRALSVPDLTPPGPPLARPTPPALFPGADSPAKLPASRASSCGGRSGPPVRALPETRRSGSRAAGPGAWFP